MTTEQTPTTSAVRMAYSYVDGILGKQTWERKAEFDRWLESVKREAAAEAFENWIERLQRASEDVGGFAATIAYAAAEAQRLRESP
jgi:hypothetical protein